MPEYDLGLTLPAHGCLPEAERLVSTVLEHESTRCRIFVRVIAQADLPQQCLTRYNISSAKNAGIRACLAKGCRVIACCDADQLIPPGLLDYVAAHTVAGRHLWAVRRNLLATETAARQWMRWLDLPTFEPSLGSFNALTAEDWKKVGGWDERAFGWGGDDDLLHLRIRQAGIVTQAVRQFPLMHVDHRPRPFLTQCRRSAENMRLSQVPQPNYLGVPAHA